MDVRTRGLYLQWGRVERSDPFAAARAACHYREGIAKPFEADYEAVEDHVWEEVRGPAGKIAVRRTIWKRMRRP
jgi:hypothetical protein